MKKQRHTKKSRQKSDLFRTKCGKDQTQAQSSSTGAPGKDRKKTEAGNEPSPPAAPLVRIEKPIYGGAFLARVAGKAVFVPLTLPGEEARVRIVEEKRNFATAEVEEIVAPARERIAPLCPHFAACGGCCYQHADYAAQLGYKQQILRETLARGGVQAPEEMAVLAAQPWSYRNRVRLAVDAKGHVGYRGRRSHAIVPLTECPIAAPLLTRTVLATGALLRDLPQKTRVSEIALFCDAQESALLASVTMAHGGILAFDEFARELVHAVPEVLGVEFAAEAVERQPPQRLALWGASSLAYRAAGFDDRVDHGAFFQVNRWLVDALVDRVVGNTQGELAWDLFSGVGLFARRLADRFARVVAVESAPQSADALAHNLRDTKATAVKATTRDFLRRKLHGKRSDGIVPDLIVVDPPRAGLGAETTALLAAAAAPQIVYVSCDPATLVRDLRVLIAAGYKIEQITLADLFPQTFHLETIVRLRR